MGKKDRMLGHIMSNVDWFMTTTTSVEVIPYYDLTSSVFNKARQYFASNASYEDVVCLISTSIMEPGKSGILFTIDCVYCKAWGGILTSSYTNWLFTSYSAEFGVYNEFDTERMKELMSDLADIAIEEDEKEEEERKKQETIKKLENIGKAVGVAALTGMALVDIASSISDEMVSQNNEDIVNNILQLGDSDDEQIISAKNIYKDFMPHMNTIVGFIEKNENGEADDDTSLSFVSEIHDILVKLYGQALANEDISPDNNEEYQKHLEWLKFWALMFYDENQFREEYDMDGLQDMPKFWEAIIELVDSLYEDVGGVENVFSDCLSEFTETVIDNMNEREELMSDSEFDEEFLEAMTEIVESDNQAVHSLKETLDMVTDFLYYLLQGDESE